MGTTLAHLVGDTDHFLSDVFGRVPHRFAGERSGELFTLADADVALSTRGLRRPAVRLVRGGEALDPRTWTRRARTGSTRVEDLVDPERALGAFDDGTTIVFQSLQRWWPAAKDLCRRLEAELGHEVQANAYLSPPGSPGLVPHHDTHDVFVVQTHGTKHWTLRSPVRELPLRSQPSDHDAAAARPVDQQLSLEEGDCLYLPRGWVHSAEAPAGISLHVTIGVLVTTLRDVVGRLLDRAAEDLVSLRRAAPRHEPSQQLTTAVKGAVAELLDWLSAVDAAEVAAAEVQRFRTTRPLDAGGHLLDLDRLDGVDDRSVVRPRSAGVTLDGEADGALVVTSGARRITLPAATRVAVERLVAPGASVRVGELSDVMDAASRAVLVRRLVRDGVLALDDPA